MTKQECAVVQAYTGVCMLTGDDAGIYYSYIQHLLGRPVFTHELGEKVLTEEIKKKSKEDFIALCDEAVDLESLWNDLSEYL